MNYQSDIFNKAAIYDMLFFNVKTVLEYPNLDELEKNKPDMYENWKILMTEKFNSSTSTTMAKLYEEYAINYPEYSKIITISYGKIYMNDVAGKVDRILKKITGFDEAIILETFFDVLTNMPDVTLVSFNGNKDLQTLVKRFLYRRAEVNTIKTLPSVLKKALNAKPWESGNIDINYVWKFNSYEINLPALSVMSDFLGLKKNTELMTDQELSKYYWTNIDEKTDETLKFVELQSINNTNLLIQFINEIRNI